MVGSWEASCKQCRSCASLCPGSREQTSFSGWKSVQSWAFQNPRQTGGCSIHSGSYKSLDCDSKICVPLQNSGIVLIICHGKTKGLQIARNILSPFSIENTSRNLVEKGIFSLWLLMPQTIEISKYL